MHNFLDRLDVIAKDTDVFLNNFFLKKNKKHLNTSMRYSIFSGGKRFRSAIIINTGKIFNINYKKLIPIAAAVECIHSYSLIHDDLPAMDNDDLRRGKLATHKKFNEFTAILAGNSLLTLAFEILSSKSLKFSSRIKNELIFTLSAYSGASGLAGGQYYDITFENKNISKKKIIEIQKNKTGKLFAFCCESAGIIKQYNLNERNKLKSLGLNIGLLFQIADDLIDFKGNSKIAGKQTKKDKKKGKQTLVKILGYKETLKLAKRLEKKINNEVKKYGIKSNDLIQSIEFILKRKF